MQNFMKTIVNAIQSWTKAKIKDSAADWNENNSSADSYVKNRTHYKINAPETILFEEYLPCGNPKTTSCKIMPLIGTTIHTYCNGKFLIDSKIVSSGDGRFMASNGLIDIDFDNNGTITIQNYHYDCVLKIVAIDAILELKKLDKDYMPDSVATVDMVDNKMNKANPTGTGSFSMNRKANTTIGDHSHAEGYNTTASGKFSHAEGYYTTASGNFSHAEGYNTTTSGNYSHTEGNSVNQIPTTITSSSTNETIATAWNTTRFTLAKGVGSHAEGKSVLALGDYSHAEGNQTTASGHYSHAEGDYTTASGRDSHAEGSGTIASGQDSHAEGFSTRASGNSSHAEGQSTTASGDCSHAEGCSTEASGMSSHAEGENTTASGYISHAEGCSTKAQGDYSHAEGYTAVANAYMSHAEGNNTIASGQYQHVQGQYNIEDTSSTYAHIVGNGSASARSNAHTLDWNGNAWFAGKIYSGGQSQDDEEAVEVALKTDIVQSDWNAAEGEAGHVKNRTHWSETEETVIFEESEISWSVDTEFAALLELSEEIVVGSTYKVAHNGTEYILDAVNFEGQIVLGNTGYLSSDGEENGVPFALVYTEEMSVFLGFNVLSDDESVFVDGSATLGIVMERETVQRLPAKFAPSYIITDVDGTAINESFDNFADVLWNGGTVCIRAKTENGYTAYNVVSWNYGYSEETGGVFTLCGYNFGVSMAFMATNGTWTPPT